MSRCHAQPEQPLDFLGLAGPAQEVQVECRRRLEWRLGDALEAQVEHRLPEPAQPLRLDGVDDEVVQVTCS